MSRTTKKKYVVEEVLNVYDLPTNEQEIVKVVRSCGNNLHEVVSSKGHKYLASMPPKFRKHIWIKRGNFIVVDPIVEGVKVKGEISRILLKDQIKYFKDQGVWPKEFSETVTERRSSPEVAVLVNKKSNEKSRSQNEDGSAESDLDDLFVNTNRPDEDSESETSDSEDDLFVNTNRPIVDCSSTSSESEDECDK